MNWNQNTRSALAVGCAVVFLGIPAAQACGLCSPEFLRKVAVNLDYPDALHVEGRVWAAQKAGRLPKPDMKRLLATGSRRKVLDSMTKRKTVASLKTFGTILAAAEKIPGSKLGGVSVLLVDEMMWNRFALVDGKAQLSADVGVRGEGGLVIVTESVVIGAIAGGSLSIPDAIELGVLRVYGSPVEGKEFFSQARRSTDQP